MFGENNRFQLGGVSTVTPQGVGGFPVIVDRTPAVNPKVIESMLTQCVNEHVYPKQKFIILDEELAFGGKLQKCVLNKLKVQGSAEEFWRDNKETIRKKLNRKRNNVQEVCRKKMTGAYDCNGHVIFDVPN